MKMTTGSLVAVLAAFGLTTAASAQVVTFDPPDYSSGANELNGQDGWTAVAGAWDTGGVGVDASQAMRNITPSGTSAGAVTRDFSSIPAGTISYQIHVTDPGADRRLSHWLLPLDSSTGQYVCQFKAERYDAFSDSQFRWRIEYSDSPTQGSGDGLVADDTAMLFNHWFEIRILFDVNDTSGGSHGTFSVEVHDLTLGGKRMWESTGLAFRSDGGAYAAFAGLDRFHDNGSKANGTLIEQHQVSVCVGS